jgi:phenylalanyl-tRNA synthetase alpha chain
LKLTLHQSIPLDDQGVKEEADMSHLQQSLQSLKDNFLQQAATVDSQKQIEDLRIRFLGKKGELTQILRGMGLLEATERPMVGQIANDIRELIEQQLSERLTQVKQSKDAAWNARPLM